jgi:DNA-binding transcriptional MerR regulator
VPTLTVSLIARRCGLSRTALLYYESIGLLGPPRRTAANYRVYTERDVARLEQICAYRNAGLALGDIRTLLDRPEDDASAVLKRRLAELDAEIETLRRHQRAILALLRTKSALWRKGMITKQKWVSIMKGAGFSEDDMHRWHAEFERSAPDEHQEFLAFLRIPREEIRSIRTWSRSYDADQAR